MPDGKQWTTENLSVATQQSYCYDDSPHNCAKYGRLYTFNAAKRACASLGAPWRLPTNDEWRNLAKHYGGLLNEDASDGKAAYQALFIGGRSGFKALLSGGRAVEGQYARLDAHGFYWTASENDSRAAWFYNFGKGNSALSHLPDGEKERAFSVRFLRD